VPNNQPEGQPVLHLKRFNAAIPELHEVIEKLDYLPLQCEIWTIQLGPRSVLATKLDVPNNARRWGENWFSASD